MNFREILSQRTVPIGAGGSQRGEKESPQLRLTTAENTEQVHQHWAQPGGTKS